MSPAERSLSAVRLLIAILSLGTAVFGHADALPGIVPDPVAKTQGFLTSITFDASNRLFYSTREGGIFRLDGDRSVRTATVDTVNDGNPFSNAGLLGIIFADDGSLVAHWVSPDVSADVIGRIDPTTGAITEIARLICYQGLSCSTEHHGGNLTRGPEGAIFFGIGDFFLPALHAQNPNSPGGKIHRLARDGSISIYALGLRNPFDMALDAQTGALIVADNGTGEWSDEINVVSAGDNLGWPLTAGRSTPVAGTKPPTYVFPDIVAPTGVVAVASLGGYPLNGFAVGAYVTQSIYYFPDLTGSATTPITLLDTRQPRGVVGTTHVTVPADAPIIDVVQNLAGDLYFATPTDIFRVHFPRPGDVNGDGIIDANDLEVLQRELVEGTGEHTYEAPQGNISASWGADVDVNGVIDGSDEQALRHRLIRRRRAVRR